MTQQEYIQKIDQAFVEKKFDDVILLENELMSLAYADLAKQESLVNTDAAYSLPKDKIFTYFQKHGYSSVLNKKGIASMLLGDFYLSGQSFEEAINSLGSDDKFAEPYFYLAYLQYSQNLPELATKTLKQGLNRNPQLLDGFDELFEDFLEPIAKAGTKEVFKNFCKNTKVDKTI